MDAGSIISVRNFDLLHLIFYPSHHIRERERKGERAKRKGEGKKEHKCFSLKQKIIILRIFLGRKVKDPGDKIIAPIPLKRRRRAAVGVNLCCKFYWL